MRPFEGNQEADVAPSENELDTPDLQEVLLVNKLPQEKTKPNSNMANTFPAFLQ